jgi:mRNA interferase MazF
MANFAPGDVVRVDLDPSKGKEQTKIRPALVVSDTNPLGLVVVLPITDADKKEGKKLFVPIVDLKRAGLSKPSVVDVFQIRCIDPVRIKGTMGKVTLDVMNPVRVALANMLGIDEEHVAE